MIVGADCRSFVQELLSIFAGPVNRVDKPQLHFSIIEAFANYFDVIGMAAGILDFAPAETDLAIDSEQKCLFSFGLGWFRNVLRGQIHRVIEQHAGRLTGLLVFQNLAAERIWRVFVDLGDGECRGVRNCGVAVGTSEKNGIVRRNLIEIGM